MDARGHLAETRASLSTSPLVRSITVVEERLGYDYGYFRARLTLFNDDFLEVAEYFVIQDDQVQVRRYRYQWMGGSQRVLKKRWDNTKHFPELPNFPDHVHVGEEELARPGQSLTIIGLLSLMERKLRADSDIADV